MYEVKSESKESFNQQFDILHICEHNILLRVFISEEEQIKVTRGHVWRIRWMQHKNSVVLRQELLKNESRICQCVVVVKYY